MFVFGRMAAQIAHTYEVSSLKTPKWPRKHTEKHGNNYFKAFFFRVIPCASVAKFLSKCHSGLSLLCPGLLLLPCVVQAGVVQDSSVHREGDVYSLSITAHVEAPLEQVYRSVTDFANLAAINPSIEESGVLESQGNRQRVRSVIRVCILVFCKRVVQVQDVTLVDARTVVAVMVPGEGDFRAGMARWQLTPVGGGTELLFTETFEPDFWVPPLIGTWLIERELVREVAETAMYIEGMTNGS